MVRKDNNTVEYRIAKWDGKNYEETHILHNNRGPALIVPGESEEWYWRGQLYRENGPAITRSNGIREWFYKGQRHRIGGPAIEYPNGEQAWYQFGKKHRIGGPATIYKHNGHHAEYWIEGVEINKNNIPKKEEDVINWRKLLR